MRQGYPTVHEQSLCYLHAYYAIFTHIVYEQSLCSIIYTKIVYANKLKVE